MANVLTTTYKFTQPEVGGADDQWGDLLNANWGKVDNLLYSADHTETGFTNATSTVLGTGFRVAGASPHLQLSETDATLPEGRYRFTGVGGAIQLLANTATAGDFSTSQAIFTGGSTELRIGVLTTIVDTSPRLHFDETDAPGSTAGQYAFYGGGEGSFYFARYAGAAFTNAVTIWSYSLSNDRLTFNVPVTVDGISGALEHAIDSGYMYVGSYSTATYGNGYARLYMDYNGRQISLSAVDSNKANASGIGLIAGAWQIDDDGSAVFGAPFEIAGTSATLRFTENDQVDPAGKYAWSANSGDLVLYKYTAANWGAAVTKWRYDNATNRITQTVGLDVSGSVTANSFVGSGEFLTDIPKIATALNQVGNYVMVKNISANSYSAGSVAPAASLKASDAVGTEAAATLTGTWRVMGNLPDGGYVSLAQKIT